MIPISIIVSPNIPHEDITEWLINNVVHGEYVCIWPFLISTFYHDEDATAFMLKFNGKRILTKVELLIRAAG